MDVHDSIVDEISSLLWTNYGLKVYEIDQLDGFEDLNFRIVAENSISGGGDTVTGDEPVAGHGRCKCSREEGVTDRNTYILKLSRTIDNGVDAYIDLQHAMMCHLHVQGITTSRPIATLDRQFHFKHEFTDKNSGVRTKWRVQLLAHVPGITLLDAGNPPYLMVQVGRFTGQMDSLLQNFRTDLTPMTNALWELSGMPKLSSYVQQYCTESDKPIGFGIIDQYKSKIAPYLGHLQRGFIHGDVNNANFIVKSERSNIIVKPEQSNCTTCTYKLSGIIDFGDACNSFYVFEIATIMADLMSSCLGSYDIINVAKDVLTGYRQCFRLTDHELGCLRLCVCIRLLQLYTLSQEASLSDPGNSYVTLEQGENMEVCRRVWAMSDEEFDRDIVARSETTKS